MLAPTAHTHTPTATWTACSTAVSPLSLVCRCHAGPCSNRAAPEQRRVVHAAAAPEGVNVEQVADMIAAAPLDDQREWITMEGPHSSSWSAQEPTDSTRGASPCLPRTPLSAPAAHAPLPAFNPLPTPHSPTLKHTCLPRLLPPVVYPMSQHTRREVLP